MFEPGTCHLSVADRLFIATAIVFIATKWVIRLGVVVIIEPYEQLH